MTSASYQLTHLHKTLTTGVVMVNYCNEVLYGLEPSQIHFLNLNIVFFGLNKFETKLFTKKNFKYIYFGMYIILYYI